MNVLRNTRCLHVLSDRGWPASGAGLAAGRYQDLLDKVTQQPDFAAGNLPGCDVGNGVSAGERADERGAMRDYGADRLAETGQLLRQLAALERASIDPIWDQDHVWTSVAAGPNRIDDFQRSDCRLDVKSRGCAWHQHEIGKRNCSAKGAITGSGVDNNIGGRNPFDVANPILDGLIRKGHLVNRKIEIAGLGPLASRSLRIAVDQGGIRSPPAQFRRNGHCQRGFADPTLTLRYRDNLVHRLPTHRPAVAYANFFRGRPETMVIYRPQPNVAARIPMDERLPVQSPMVLSPTRGVRR